MYKNSYFWLVAVGVVLVVNLASVSSRRICGPNLFRCRNGRGCVAALDVCDNQRHCKDGSDENIQFCSGNFTGLTKNLNNECSPGSYRCRFGGCVKASHLCDGRLDCFDGSDETYDICRRNRCQKSMFRCDYGGCIRGNLNCNGKRNCPDSSDETRALCEDYICPTDSFKCNYGACIPSSKVCDTKSDCLDKSDEFKSVCTGEFDTLDQEVDFKHDKKAST